MKRLLVLALSLFASAAFAQTVCTVTYGYESESMDGNDTGKGSIILPSMPMSEVNFNHDRQMKVLDAMSKEQDATGKDAKGRKFAAEEPMYKTDVYEIRACDGGPGVKMPIGQGSASIQGISYAGTTRIADVMLQQFRIVNDRHKARVAKGEKSAWDHSKAPKVKRNDVGVRVN